MATLGSSTMRSGASLLTGPPPGRLGRAWVLGVQRGPAAAAPPDGPVVTSTPLSLRAAGTGPARAKVGARAVPRQAQRGRHRPAAPTARRARDQLRRAVVPGRRTVSAVLPYAGCCVPSDAPSAVGGRRYQRSGWNEPRLRSTCSGVLDRVASDTSTIVAKANGTLTAAGWVRTTPNQPPVAMPNVVVTTAPIERAPPTTRPEIAPREVSPRHQIPRRSIGQNVDAATANVSSTAWATGTPAETTVSTSAPATTATVVRRNVRMPWRCPAPQRTRSWLTTPATDTTRPVDVERNAANAPAARTAVSPSATGPSKSRLGSSRTTESARPAATRSEAT